MILYKNESDKEDIWQWHWSLTYTLLKQIYTHRHGKIFSVRRSTEQEGKDFQIDKKKYVDSDACQKPLTNKYKRYSSSVDGNASDWSDKIYISPAVMIPLEQ